MSEGLEIRVTARREPGPSPAPPGAPRALTLDLVPEPPGGGEQPAPQPREPAAPLRLVASPRPHPAPEARSRRGRVRAALRCPYCRDEVGRRGAVACRRAGCGAVYHRACWAECLVGHGGCGVYGCGAPHSRELSGMGWAWRVMRLTLAALVLPPRLLRQAMGGEERQAGLLRTAWGAGQSIQVGLEGFGVGPILVVSAVVCWGSLLFFIRELQEHPAVVVLLGVGGPFLGLLVPRLLAFLGALGWLLARGALELLHDEAGVLERVVFSAEARRR
mgnify:CR=1 FL=1